MLLCAINSQTKSHYFMSELDSDIIYIICSTFTRFVCYVCVSQIALPMYNPFLVDKMIYTC